ncbi:MAG: hypothetical protein BRD48_03395 [Bacteroidetes bacterium QS_9_68_14]|nr:MAG: hypothetical protein BRD48_03395 [Bacteroidetes bacterium QS_9_68_14]
MAQQATEWFGMRLTPDQKAQIERLAEQRDSTQKDAVMRLVEQAVADEKEKEPIEAEPGSILDLAGDLIGSIDDPNGPTDLSTNPKHMEDYGKD